MSQIRERIADFDELESLADDFAPDYWSEEDAEELPEPKATRGRKKILPRWTRVFHVSQSNIDSLPTYDIGADLLLESGLTEALREPDDGVDY